MSTSFSRFLLFLLTAGLLLPARAQMQVPDTTFGGQGKTYTLFGSFNCYMQASCLQPDDKIVTVGYNGNSTNAILVSRHDANGQPDSSFNGTGLRRLDFGFTYEEAWAVMVTSTGRIVVAGQSFGNAALAALLNDGTFDSTFNQTGLLKVSFGPGNGSRIDKLLEQPDGRYLACGRAYNGSNFDFMAMRLFPDGQLDTTFGDAGKAIFDAGGFADFAYDAQLQEDGKLVLVGYSNDAQGKSRFSVARITPAGLPDSSFAVNGFFLLDPGLNHNELDALQIQPDGYLVAAGRNDSVAVVLRLNPVGALDTAFGNQGYVNLDVNGVADRAYDLALLPGGKILVGGQAFTTTGTTDFFLVRLLGDGSPDPAFHENGVFLYDMGSGGSWVQSILLQQGGRIVLSGIASLVPQGFSHFALLGLRESSSVGLEETVFLRQQLKIYPNPATGTCYVTLGGNQGQRQHSRVLDFSGKVLLDVYHEAEEPIDLSSLAGGFYLIEVRAGKRIGTGKLVKR